MMNALRIAALACMTAAGAMAPLPEACASAGGYRVYVTNEGSGDVTVIDGQSLQVVATIPLGKRPRGIVADPGHRRLYVALSGSPLAGPGVDEKTLPPPDKRADGIAIIDARTNTVARVLRGSSDPEQLALSGDGRTLYVASEDTGQGIEVDVVSGRVRGHIAVGGEPEGVAINPQRNVAYFTSETDNRVAAVDLERWRTVGSAQVGQRPRDIAVSADGATLYVTGENDASLSVLDAATLTVRRQLTVPGNGARPKGIAVSADGGRLYVSTGRGGEVVAYDTKALAVVGSVKVGTRPWGLALSPDGQRLFVANGPSDDVSVVVTGPMTVEATVAAGQRPWGIATLGQE